MSVRWELIVEETQGVYHSGYAARVLEQVEGSREDAAARLEVLARSYEARFSANPRRRRLYRTADGFLLIDDRSDRPFSHRFTVAELLYDSAAEKEAARAAKEEKRNARRAAAAEVAEEAARERSEKREAARDARDAKRKKPWF